MVAAGVALHLPMFWMGRNTHFRLSGMPMGVGMLAGMAAIILGIAAAAYGLLPHRPHRLTREWFVEHTHSPQPSWADLIRPSIARA